MKLPLWKKWLSYARSIHLEYAESDYNDELHVLLSRGRFQLCTANAIYSFDDLYVNFDSAFQQLHIQKHPPKNVLVLGLGLGSIPYLLEKKYGIHTNYTAVEIDEAVIDLAHRYTLSKLDASINYICADAEVFVQMHEEQYDLICMDIFKDTNVPKAFESEEFLQHLARLLSPKGTLLYNRLAFSKNDIAKTSAFYKGAFKTVFPEGYYMHIKGNWMLCNRK